MGLHPSQGIPPEAVTQAGRSRGSRVQSAGVTTTYSPATFALGLVDADHDYRIFQGGTYEQEIQLKLNGSPLNLSAYAATPPVLQLRKQLADASPFVTPVLSWIDASTARIKVRIEASVTLGMGTAAVDNGVGDIKVINGLDALLIAKGTWVYVPSATR